jgi:predicted acylesterase/phospholipase RssA
MAIPGFFEPKALDVRGETWQVAVKERLGGLVADRYVADIAAHRELSMVDGGLLSNVPVDAFERMILPSDKDDGGERPFPTIVATLVRWDSGKAFRSRRSAAGLFDDVLRLAQAVRLQRDRDALRRLVSDGNKAVRIVEIDTTGYNWLNFTMSEDEMGRLFVQGLKRAKEFLKDLIEPGESDD